MENNNNNERFTYTYSAKEQEEIKRIRQKYQPKEVDKMEQVRRLDARVNSKAVAWSLALGILGMLIMGSGMSLTMTDLGEKLGMSGSTSLILGIVIGIVGMVIAAFAYPTHNKILKRERERIAPEILKLTEELMK